MTSFRDEAEKIFKFYSFTSVFMNGDRVTLDALTTLHEREVANSRIDEIQNFRDWIKPALKRSTELADLDKEFSSRQDEIEQRRRANGEGGE